MAESPPVAAIVDQPEWRTGELQLAPDLVPEICRELDLSMAVCERACEWATAHGVEDHTHHSPSGLAAGAVYLAGIIEAEGEPPSQTEVAAAAGVTAMTVRARFKHLADAEEVLIDG